ncbi:MAG: hypothetical protein JWO80_1886 [Bryobacterales bacterium]|nr:hypothetical protein [Bryobacterales bacterium]
MRPKAGKVAAFGLCGLVECLANARIPERLTLRAFLLEHEFFRRGSIIGSLREQAINKVPNTKDATTAFALWLSDLLVPNSLLDFDGGCDQVHVLPLERDRPNL